MRKENGRLKPAKEEASYESGKKYKCLGCKYVAYYKNITFGNMLSCPVCGCIMEEILFV